MRLSPEEIAGIRAAADEVFGPGAVVRLYGRRVDESKRGGDIDLLVEAPPGRETVRMTAIDAYNEAEKIGALADAKRFLEIARLRHRLAHEYPMDDAARAKRVNDAYALAPALLEEFDRLAAYAARLTPEGDPS